MSSLFRNASRLDIDNALPPVTSQMAAHHHGGRWNRLIRASMEAGLSVVGLLGWLILAGMFFHSGRLQAQSTCVYALDKTASNALSLTGTATVNASTCGIMVDSSSSSALSLTGTSSLTAKSIQIVGSYSKASNSTLSPTPQTGVAYQTDPLAFFTQPTSSSCNYTNVNISGSVTKTLSPGTYCNGIVLASSANVTFQPGTYVLMGGGLNVSGSTTVKGSGVTFFNTAGLGYAYKPVIIGGTAVLSLTAPTSGSYQGLLFWQDRTIPAGQPVNSINGTAGLALQGVFYFPTTGLAYTGTSSNSNGSCVLLVADTITFTGTATLKDNSTSCPALLPPVGVTVSPSAAVLYGGKTQQFAATVTNTVNTAVTWSVSPSSAGSISSNGLYTAPSAITTQQTVTVTATSQADSTKTASATVTLMPPIAVSVSPMSATLYGGQTQQFAATVVNTNNTAVTWSISPAGVGTISAGGLYTAPATISTQQTVTATATSVADPTKAASAAVILMPPVAVSVNPPSVTLYATQTQQFTATVTNTSNTAVTWTVSPAGTGSIDASGNYTAPASIPSQQTVTVTAVSQANTTKSASATVTLMPPITISITPPSVTLSASQTQTFTATVTNTGNTAVTWTITPTGLGTVSTSGLYTAPSTITTSQTVTITATSQANQNVTASATINLVGACNSNGYAYVRTIVIDHTKVPNSDQTNFPFLFSATDPWFKSTANGGHVTSANGYDIIFSTDPAGMTALDHQLEEYNPATGQIIAWVRIPTLSHTADTSIYLFYGNSSVTTPQQNPAGVWDSDYLSVLHLDESTGTTVYDSTSNGNNGTKVSQTSPASIASGEIGGAQSFNGTSDFISLPPSLSSGRSHFSVSFWANTTDTTSNGTYWNRPEFFGDSTSGNASGDFGVNTNSGDLGMWSGLNSGGDNSTVTTDLINDGNWHRIDAVNDGSTITLYLDGKSTGATLSSGLALDSFGWYLGAQHYYAGGANYFHQGDIDEFRFSDSVRTADWISTEYSNQSSPATFYSLGVESNVAVSPAAVDLYAAQTEQFTAAVLSPGSCTSAVTWSRPSGSPGTLSSGGLYAAPLSIAAEQTVTVIATSTADPTKIGTATVTLLPTPQNPTLTLAASAQPPYVTGTTQQFVATLANQGGTPLAGAAVTFNVTGANVTNGSGTTSATGAATFSYTGANSGADTIQAVATIAGVQVTSNSLAVNWVAPVQQVSTTTVTGEFFLSDGSGTFDTSPSATPAFTQVFPTINFNPPAGTVPGNTSDVNVNSRPFTDVTTDLNGNFTGTIVAQGNGYQAGVGPMYTFQAVLRGEFTIAGPGTVTFNFFTDDGFVIGIGNGATRVSGAFTDAPAATPFSQLPVMGAYNVPTSPTGNQVVVNFPAAGKYPYEIDYSECCGGQLVLTMTQGASSPTGVAPTGSLTISPGSVQPLPVGGQQAFTILASDAGGNPVPNTNVSLVVTGADNLQLSGTTDSTGHATIVYKDVNSGTATVQAVAFIGGMVTYSNQVTVPWTQSATTTTGTGTGSGTGASLSVSISAPNTVILPSTLPLSGSATDTALPAGNTISLAWSEVSGPGSVAFSAPQQGATTASFSEPGSYQLQLTATDVNGTASAQVTVSVNPQPGTAGGWIGGPAYGAQVSGIVPITVASGVTLTSGTLTVYPASNPGAVTVLNSDTTGSGQIGTWDTTQVANGTYWITLQATTSAGASEYNLALVTVVGNYKPGRVTTTVTDLVAPVNGLPIKIQRIYDSLNANTVGDFGYGWNLATSVDLTVDPQGNVTFTLGGIRRTFDLTPQFLGWLFPYYVPAYTPEPGFHGTLAANGAGCADFFDFLVPDGSLWVCIGGGYYNPASFVYTDPTGTSYLISAAGNLQAMVDKNGNRLDITTNGITSSTGIAVPFVRDSSGRITTITDPQGNVYRYGYDASGNLVSVTYPNKTTPATYTYDSNHFYLSGTDFDNNPLPQTGYYTQGATDPNGLPLNGRLMSVTDALGETTSYTYNLKTNTTTITYPPDAGGNVGTATIVYSSAGDVLSSTDPLGHTTTNVYDSNRNLTSTTDPMGQITSYTYDSNGNKTSTTYPKTATSSNTTSTTTYNQYSEPTQATDELGNTRYFNYDVNLNPQNITDSLGTVAGYQFSSNGTMQAGAVGVDINAQPSLATQFTYDAYGNTLTRTDALGRTTSYTYDSLGHKLSSTDPPQNAGQSGATTTYAYDPFGNLTDTYAPLNRHSSSSYDGNGNKSSDTDALGNKTTYKYDALNRLTESDYPDGTKATKTYDFRGNVITETDQASRVTMHVYDLAGRETSRTTGYGTSSASTVSYAYDSDGRLLSETDTLGHSTGYSYDAAGNLTGESGVNGTFTFGYDSARNQVSMTDGNGNVITHTYDSRKRLLQSTFPDSTTKTYTYNGAGNLTSITDQAGNSTQFVYDAANQLQKVIEVNSPNSPANTALYGFDGDKNLINWTDANGHTTAAAYDLLSEPTSKTLPDGTLAETRTYDQNGNLLSLTHFSGVTTTYTYDSLNRLLSRSTPGEAPVSFTYTLTGKRATMTDASGTTTYLYDSLDRLSSKATPEGTLSYTYDGAGNLTSMTSSNANGTSVSYTYDNLNRLSTVVDGRLSGANTTTYTYDSASNVASATLPNALQSIYTYDKLNRTSGVASQLGGYVYQHDPVGNRTSAVESNGRTTSWNYDALNRLTNETVASAPSGKNGSVSYGLDPVGNRSSVSSTLSGVPSGSFTFDSDDHLSAETYDSNGNALSANGKTFAYDSQNQLTSANGGAITLVYDGDGNRVAKSVNGVITRYLIDDLNPTGFPQVAEEISGTGAVGRIYTYGLQLLSENQVANNTWTPSFYLYDGMKTVRALTNAVGAVTDTYEYDAFGNSFTVSGSTPNNYLYRGEQFDTDLGLYYFRARYYNPLTGRFVSQDPYAGQLFDPKSLHRYQYGKANPVNRVDPSGMDDAVEEAELIDIESEGAVEGEEALAKEINCIFYEAASVLFLATDYDPFTQTLLSLVPEPKECGAEADYGSTCGLCFAAGTPVHSNHGDIPVDKVEVGDEVISRNRRTGKLEANRVTDLTPPHMDQLEELRVAGEAKPLHPTRSHPFWVRHEGESQGQWLPAVKLHPGDLLQTANGNWSRILSALPLSQEQTVYNFTVDQDHDYFVGDGGFLVHNACPCHGNSRNSPKTTFLYVLVDGADNFLKWGISQNPAGRYSGTFLRNTLGGGRVIPIASGPRSDILDLERLLCEYAPGPLNHEPWAGRGLLP